FRLALHLAAIILEARDAQRSGTTAFREFHPGTDFFFRKIVARADVGQSNETLAHRIDHNGLAANHPALGVGRGEMREIGIAIKADDLRVGASMRIMVRHVRSYRLKNGINLNTAPNVTVPV